MTKNRTATGPMLLCCLSFCLPTKISKLIRRVLLPIGAIVILYFLTVLLILYNFNLSCVDTKIEDNRISLVFRAVNNAFSGIELKDINLINENGVRAKKYSKKSLPILVPRYSEQDIGVKYALEEFKKIEVSLRVLLSNYTFKHRVAGGEEDIVKK